MIPLPRAIPICVATLTIGSLAAGLAVMGNAQGAVSQTEVSKTTHVEVTPTAPVGHEPTLLESLSFSAPVSETTPTVQTLDPANPATPWPQPSAQPSTTLPLAANPLSYTSVGASAEALLKGDYATWASYLGQSPKQEALPQGLIKASDCLKPDCNTQRSLLIIDPTQQKVFVALVNHGRITMRPSLMSWPDAAIPSLKSWLADATEHDDE